MPYVYGEHRRVRGPFHTVPKIFSFSSIKSKPVTVVAEATLWTCLFFCKQKSVIYIYILYIQLKLNQLPSLTGG